MSSNFNEVSLESVTDFVKSSLEKWTPSSITFADMFKSYKNYSSKETGEKSFAITFNKVILSSFKHIHRHKKRRGGITYAGVRFLDQVSNCTRVTVINYVEKSSNVTDLDIEEESRKVVSVVDSGTLVENNLYSNDEEWWNKDNISDISDFECASDINSDDTRQGEHAENLVNSITLKKKKSLDIRNFTVKGKPTFELKEEFLSKYLQYRQIEKEHKYFDYQIFSRHCSSKLVRSMTPTNMPSLYISFDELLTKTFPKPTLVSSERNDIFVRSTVSSTTFEKQVKSLLCRSFLPVVSGNIVSTHFKWTEEGDQFPQFLMTSTSKLEFKCQICPPHSVWCLSKGRVVKKCSYIIEGFQQVYVHYVSKQHKNALHWWTSNMIQSTNPSKSSSNLCVESISSSISKQNENKITHYMEIEDTSKLKLVQCMYVWDKDIVDQFKGDSYIRRKQPKTLFKEQKLWLKCENKSDHSSCCNYKIWKENHSDENKVLLEDAGNSFRSVFVPGVHELLIRGKSVTILGGLKSLEPMCTGKAPCVGEHPYTCDSCYKQVSIFNNLIEKRKTASLNTQESRFQKKGFRHDYASTAEKDATLSNLIDENKKMKHIIWGFQKLSYNSKNWVDLLNDSCQNQDQEKLIIDLLHLFSKQSTTHHTLQYEVIKNMVGKMKSGVNHHFTHLIKDISVLHCNRLGKVNYSLLQSIFKLGCTTTVVNFKKKDKLELGFNSKVIEKASEMYDGNPVVDCTDEARILRFVTPVLNKSSDQIELVGECFEANHNLWSEKRQMLPLNIHDHPDEFLALKEYIDDIIERNALAKACGIHNFASLAGPFNKPLIYLLWPTPNKGYKATNMLQIWDRVRHSCFYNEDNTVKENPIMLLGHSSDSAGFQLSAAVSLMTPNKTLIQLGVKYLSLGIGESRFAAPYLSFLPSIAYLDYDHEIRLFLKCLKYQTLDLKFSDGIIASIDHLKELKSILLDVGESCPFSDGDLLFARYLDQNCDAALKVFNHNNAELLLKHVPGSNGTVLYIIAVVELLSCFINPSTNPNKMQQSVSTGITILRMWRKVVEIKKWRLYSLPGANINSSKRGNFLTYGTYKTAEILFSAATCHMLAMHAHFKQLGPESASPSKAGTRTTERIISEIQGKTPQIQCLDAQPTLGDVLQRISNVQANQLAEERVIHAGASKIATTNRKRLAMQTTLIKNAGSYSYPLTYKQFLQEQRENHLLGVDKGKELFKKYCPEAMTVLSKRNIENFARDPLPTVQDIDYFEGTLPSGYCERVRDINSANYLSKECDLHKDHSEYDTEDEGEEESIDHCDDLAENETDSTESDGTNKWFISRMVEGKMSSIHIARAIKIHTPREQVARDRARRHIAANFLPDKKPIDPEHEIIKYRYVMFGNSVTSINIGKVICLEKNGKNVISASSDDHDVEMRVILFESTTDNIYTLASPPKISRWLKVQQVYGDIKFEKSGSSYTLCKDSLTNYEQVLNNFQVRKDFKLATKLSASFQNNDEYETVEDIVGKKIDPKTHITLYCVKFANCSNAENIWLPMSCFSETFKFNSRSVGQNKIQKATLNTLSARKFVSLDEPNHVVDVKNVKKPTSLVTDFLKNHSKAKYSPETSTVEDGTSKLCLEEKSDILNTVNKRKRKTSENCTTSTIKRKKTLNNYFPGQCSDPVILDQKVDLMPKMKGKKQKDATSLTKLARKRKKPLTPAQKKKSFKDYVKTLDHGTSDSSDVEVATHSDGWFSDGSSYYSGKDEEQKKESPKILATTSKTKRTKGLEADFEITEEIVHGKFLSDNPINLVMRLLKYQFQHINGFQETLLSEKRKFKSVVFPAIQIHHNAKSHWVTSLYTVNNIFIYDSLSKYPSKSLQSQILQCYQDEVKNSKNITLIYPKVQLQPDETSCGLFAIAYATELAFGEKPEEVKYNVEEFVPHILSCIESKKMILFPKEGRIAAGKVKKIAIAVSNN